MFCPHCGAKKRDAQSICQECGRQAPDLPEDLGTALARTGAAGNCRTCDSPLEPDEVFCGQCGTRTQKEPSTTPSLAGKRATFDTATASVLPLWRRFPTLGGQGISQPDALPDDYERSAGSNPRPSSARLDLGTALTGGEANRGVGRGGQVAGILLPEPPPEAGARSRTALVISLLCFLASLISGGAAIWLAATALH